MQCQLSSSECTTHSTHDCHSDTTGIKPDVEGSVGPISIYQELQKKSGE